MGKKRLFSIHTSPEELYTLKELESAIAEVLAEMPNNVREAFEMSRFKGMTYTSIAEKMQVSPKSIEVYISKALKILREKLQDYLTLLLLL